MKRKPKRIAKTLSTYQLIEKFPNEPATIKYLESMLWKDGVVCPYCKGKEISKKTRMHFYRCRECRKDFTVRVGTIFERSHIPLQKWMLAMYLIVTARKGISSLQLSKEIGVRQSTAWFLGHRIREACGNQIFEMMEGINESDEVYIGGLEKNRHEWKKKNLGRGAVGKPAIFGVRNRNGNVRLKPVESTNKTALQGAIRQFVKKGSTVYTDEHRSYQGLGEHYIHQTVHHSAKQYVDGMAHTNGIESVWAVLQRGFYGIFHSFSDKHRGSYANEFQFRFNEGNCSIDTVDRIDSLVKGVAGVRLTYNMLKSKQLEMVA